MKLIYIKTFFKWCLFLLLFVTIIIGIKKPSYELKGYDKKDNFINLNHEDDNLYLKNSIETSERLKIVNKIEYYKFQNVKIPIYYHHQSEFFTKLNFIKNIFIYNIDFFILDLAKKITNSNDEKIGIWKKEFIIDDFDVRMNCEFTYNDKIYKINSNFSLNKSLFFNNDIYIYLNVIDSKNSYKFKYIFDNFYSIKIEENFNYELPFNKMDITEITKENVLNYFAIDNTKPKDINYSFYEFDNYITMSEISYLFKNQTQNFFIHYLGFKKFFPKDINIEFSANENINEIDILRFDESYIRNKFNIGWTLKNIGFNLKIEKNLTQNLVKINLVLNDIKNNLFFYNFLNTIEKKFLLIIQLHDSKKINIKFNESLKSIKLPSNIKSRDIDIEFLSDINNLEIKSLEIITANNEDGFLIFRLNYLYKNIYGEQINCFIDQKLEGFLFYKLSTIEKIEKYIRSNYYKNNYLNIESLKNDLINNINTNWLIELNNLFISAENIDIKKRNNNLYISFYLKNLENKIVDKVFFNIPFNDAQDNIITNNKINIKLIIIILVLFITLVLFIIFICKLINKKKIVKETK